MHKLYNLDFQTYSQLQDYSSIYLKQKTKHLQISTMQKTNTSTQTSNQQELQKKNILNFIKSRFKQLIFYRNYQLTNNGEISIIFVSLLFLIYYSQIFIMVSQTSYNTYLTQSSDVSFVVKYIGFLLLKFQNLETQNSIQSMVIPFILFLQIICMLSYLIPIQSHQFNQMLYKYIVLPNNYIFYVPSIFLSIQKIFQGQKIYISLIIIVIALLNSFIFAYFQFQLSINAIIKNMLTRNARFSTNTKQIIKFFSFALFPVCNHILHPVSQILYYLLMVVIHANQVKENCIGFVYHQEFVSKLLGILNTFIVSANLCYLLVAIVQLQLLKSSMLSFILAFFLFFANFFMVFKKFYTKTIVIDSDLDTPTKAVIYVTWYMSCFRNTTQKKNQLYISSLLKNHINNCFDLLCICKQRQKLFDPRRNQFGKPKWQPHVDNVFIKHFFLKILKDNSKKFPKSNQILFLLAFFNLQVIQFIPQTIQLIKVLKKKSIKKMLNISQEYVLYCLAERCYAKIDELNHLRGNLNLEKVKIFNQSILKLKQIIKTSIGMFSSLWKTICSQKYDKQNLVQICKKTLKIMFQVEENYHEIKKINNVSTQLKNYMTLYSKLIAHDIHLLSQVRKQIRPNPQKNTSYNLAQIRNIQIFSKETVTLITKDNNKIRWASKNCVSMFQYKSLEEFMKLRINDLMPKYFGQHHDEYIKNWKESGYTNKINKTSYLWGTNKSGYCFSLAIYVKVIPLPIQQDFAFFAALQKLDQENQIICSQQGQMYGCGKIFSSTIKCSQKFIQDYRPNIQILMPSIFDIFLKSYYPQYKSQQFSIQTRFEGYFPINIQNVFKEIMREKQVFLNKNEKKLNFKQLYCHFLKQKMQQMTVYIQGQYLSFILNINQNYCFGRSQKKIIVLKVSGIKKNNVQRYYNQIQKMISKLQELKAQTFQARNKQKQYQKTIKKDYFKALLNPKRIKKLLQEQALQRQGKIQTDQISQNKNEEQQNSQPEQTILQSKQEISNIISNQKMIGYRKKLAINAQFQIKSQRAKYNIWRIKKGLYDQGIISRYTYNLLVGKGNGFQSMRNMQTSTKLQQKEGSNRDISKIQLVQNVSDDELLSDDLTQNQPLVDDKPNDNQTFNSATSSAAFISMTNNIKMFKIKLRSLNTPKLLYWLNVAFIFIVISAVASSITQTIISKQDMNYGQLFFTKGLQSAWTIDSLLNCKILGNNIFLINKLNTSNTNLYKSELLTYFQKAMIDNFNVAHTIMQLHVAQVQQYQKLDPRILNYITKLINMNEGAGDSNGQLKVLQFIMRQEDYIKQNINNQNIQQINQLLSIHYDTFSNNAFNDFIVNLRIGLFICIFFVFIILLAITIPIVHKIQSKIQEIIYLISKISLNQRKRYYLQFLQLNQQANKSDDFINQFNIQQCQNKFKGNAVKSNDQNALQSKMLMSSESKHSTNQFKKQKDSQESLKKDKTKFIESIYCKILTIYFVFLLASSIKFVYMTLEFSNFIKTGQIFNSVIFQKLKFSQRMWIYSYQIDSNSTDQLNINVDNLNIVDNIYNTYHQTIVSERYERFITSMATTNICAHINENLESESQKFLSYMLLDSDQLVQCSKINNGSFSNGLFNSIFLLQSKKQELMKLSYGQRIKYYNQNIQMPFDLQKTQLYVNTIIYAIQKRALDQYIQATDLTLYKIHLSQYILGLFILIFMLSWIYIYLNVAQKASYINAFLLLIPFDVLNQNPYIKLYIRNEFDYKSSVY